MMTTKKFFEIQLSRYCVTARYERNCATVVRAFDYMAGAVQLAPCKSYISDALSLFSLADVPGYPFPGRAAMYRKASEVLTEVLK